MNRLICQTVVLATLLAGCFPPSAQAQYLDQIGLPILRAATTNVDGSGIRVAQPEGQVATNPPSWQVNPGYFPQLAGRFQFTSDLGSTNVFPNSLGAESWHGNGVAGFFYGQSGGVATNVAHVDSFDADYFYNSIISSVSPTNISDPVVNQSFIFCNSDYSHFPVSEEQLVDSQYDDYAVQFNTLFVSAAGNGGPTNEARVYPPATCYNGLGVGAYGGNPSIGPTLDNGRCKPDITAPSGDYTSWSTPQVSGAAAVLMQAALRGDGGSDTNAAFDMRTIKALLLNGAVKPADWVNSSASPLDTRYGAGVVNVFNSYEQLAGGKQSFCASNSIASGGAHPPVADTNSVSATSGWDFSTIASSATDDAVNHYFFNVSNGMATATLVWNRQFGQTNINDLDLFLFNTANSNLVACSTSRVDNVEHLFLPQLAAGRYDLQVLKNGGTNVVSDAETYALVFAFVPTQLNLVGSGTNAVLTWPAYPAGFLVETTTNLAVPAWSTGNLPAAALTNSVHTLELPMTNALQFFRLRSPNL